MDCQKAKILSAPHILGDLDNESQDFRDLQAHLRYCPDCSQMYEGFEETIGFVLGHKAEFARAFKKAEVREQANSIGSVYPEKFPDSRGLFFKITAFAACLAVGFWLFFAINRTSKTENTFFPASSLQQHNPVKIELISDTGTEIIRAGQPIIASEAIKSLWINDNRHMVLNAGTELSIVPHNLGCVVKLDKGEIYTEVEHDGKPFIVETVHGRAVITGTTFNIKADGRQMQLAVVEGTVRFENDKGFRNVAAGYKSCSALNIEPALPVQCDAIKLTAWAVGPDRTQKFAVTNYQLEIDLSSAFGSEQIDLERIDYDRWIEQKRYWFKREFPHIFRFKEALAGEGIEVDYPELLIKSGDLGRFAYPEKTRTRLIPVSYESMIKLAYAYGKNELWLSDNLHIRNKNLTSENETSDLKAFDKWLAALEESSDSTSEISSELLTYSLHASMYLYKTRTLAWLAVNNDQITLKAIEKKKVAMLLEYQIKAASDCVAKFKEMFACGYSSDVCRCDKPDQSLQGVIDNIEGIKEIEKKVSEYETFNFSFAIWK